MVQFPYILFSNKRWCCIYRFNTDFIISKMWTKRYYYFLKNAKKTENSQSLCFRHSADLALLIRAWLCIKNSHSNNSTLFRWFQIIFYTFCTFCTKDIKCTNNTLYIKCTLWTQHLSHIFWQKSKFQFSLFFRPFQGVYLFLSNLFISFHSDIYLTLIFYLTAVFPYYKILGMFHIFSSGILNLISSYDCIKRRRSAIRESQRLHDRLQKQSEHWTGKCHDQRKRIFLWNNEKKVLDPSGKSTFPESKKERKGNNCQL